MGGLAYRLGRRINWNAKNQLIEAVPGIDLDEDLLHNEQYYENPGIPMFS